MRIGFVIARLDDSKNVIQKLAIALAEELNRQGETVEIVRFTKKGMLNPFWRWKMSKYDYVFVANVGLQCAYFCLLKRLHIVSKPFVAFSFGSDIRAVNHRIINIFNFLSKTAVNLLIVVNPDLEPIAQKRGYQNVRYIHNWAEALA